MVQFKTIFREHIYGPEYPFGIKAVRLNVPPPCWRQDIIGGYQDFGPDGVEYEEVYNPHAQITVHRRLFMGAWVEWWDINKMKRRRSA